MQPNPNTIDFEAIKRSVRLSEVLSRYTRVPHKEKYRIPCPIHGGERWSSFDVNEDKGLFHCFACGAGGDVIALLAKLEGISNVEAGRRLVAEYGIAAAARSMSGDAVWTELKRWTPQTIEVLPTVELPPSQPLNGYRRFSKEAIERFSLRLVPNGVLIPFREEMGGRVVGYAIRQINREPKYLNSQGFRKSDFLYGMYEYIESGIPHPKHLIVCEGQFSAIRVWDSGHRNVVATMGSSMSPTQAHILGHWAGKLTILYDGDEAGRNGANKIKELYSSIFHIDIKNLAEGEDPDSGDLTILNDGD